MAESATDLYNLARQKAIDQQANNPFYALAGGFEKGVQNNTNENMLLENQKREFQAKLSQALQQKAAEFAQQIDQSKRMVGLMNAAQTTMFNQNQDNSQVSKGLRIADEPHLYDAKVVTAPQTNNAPPSNAMMSLIGGGYGDAQGNPVAVNPPTPTGDMFGSAQQATPPQFQDQQGQMPQLPQQGQPQQDNSLGVSDYPRASLDFKTNSDGSVVPTVKNNQEDINKFNDAAAAAGVNPNGKSRRQILSEIAIQKDKQSNPYYQIQRQDKLQRTAEGYLTKQVSNRSGGLGLQDQKVNAAIHARQLIDQAYNPKTGAYDVTQVPYSELSESVANLLSGNSGTSEGRVMALKQKTAEGDLNSVISYFTGRPSNATSQDAIKQLVHIIDRQGQVSEDLRDHYVNQIKGLPIFKELDPAVGDALMKTNLGSSYKDYVSKSPDQQGNQASNVKTPTLDEIRQAKAKGFTHYNTDTGEWLR